MTDKQRELQKKAEKDTKVTAISLIVIVIQSLIIIFGMYYRWDWIAYECAAMLIIPAVIVLYYGIVAIVKANQLMAQEKKIDEE